MTKRLRELAVQAFAALGGAGLARVDFLYEGGEDGLYVNELNTLPGFTPRSLLPKAAQQAGIDFGPLVDRLVKRAYDRRRAAA